MDKYLKKFKVTNYGHCIIKEELIISDDEENEEVDVETADGSIDESFLEKSVEHTGINGTMRGPINRKRSRCIRNKCDVRNDKQSTLDMFLKTKNPESNEQFENPKNVTNDEKPRATVKAATSDNTDTLYKQFAKAHCPKCNVNRTVIRQKPRCLKCKTQLTYSCETCNKTYRTFTDLGYHLKIHHTSLTHTVNRQIHLCSICNKSFAYRKGMLQHRRIQHGYTDESCGKKFKSKHTREDEQVCDKKMPYQCDNCPFTSIYKANLTSHMLEKHMNFKKKCDNCSKTFTNPRAMRRHLKVYCNKVKRFECHHCGHKFYRKDQVLNHLNQVHFGGSLTGDLQIPRICKYCDKSLKRYEQMKCHLRRCESANLNCRDQPVDGIDKSVRTCDYCGSRLKQFERMKYHLRRCEAAPNLVNDSQKPQSCKYCDKKLEPHERMKYHLRQCESAPLEFRRQSSSDVANDKSVRTCEYCGLELKRYEHMRYHLDRCESAPSDCRLESELADQPDLDTACKNLSKTYCENCKIKRPLRERQPRCKKCETTLKFICERCPKSFNCTKLLLNHLRVKHVKNKTFHRCDKCHSSYSHLKGLKFHEKTHHPSKPTTKMYKCSKCGKKYRNEASLRKHRVSCGEEPKFHCDKCPYKTHFKSSLVHHILAKRSTCI